MTTPVTPPLHPDMSKLRAKRLFLGVPVFGHQADTEFEGMHLILSARLHQIGVSHQYNFISDSLIIRARNRLAHWFMHSDYTHWLKIDSDMKVEVDDILTLLSYDYPIIGGFYAKKGVNWTAVAEAAKRGIKDPELLEAAGMDIVANFKPLKPGTDIANIRSDEPVEVKHLGTGFMLIRKDVFVEMAAKLPELAYNASNDERNLLRGPCFHNFFGAEIDRPATTFVPFDAGGSNTLLSEDWFFSRNAQRLGIKVMACPWMKTSHYGRYEYKCDFLKTAAACNQIRNTPETAAIPQPQNGDRLLKTDAMLSDEFAIPKI